MNSLITKLTSNLDHNTEAMDYLYRRGITDETIELFQIGFESNPSSKLCGRIVFPFFDIYGKIVGWSGRALSPALEPKYWNSPEIDKNALFGLYQSIDLLHANYPMGCVVVEGQLDAISLRQVGIPAIALFGKSMNDNQLFLLRRWTNKIVLFVDSDVDRKDTYALAHSIMYNDYFEHCHILHAEKYGGKDANELLINRGDEVLYSIFENLV